MQKMNSAGRYRRLACLLSVAWLLPLLSGWLPTNLHAVTIEDIAAKNNKLIELDQEIAIAEKNKKLAELKNSFVQPEIVALPKITAPTALTALTALRHDENIGVIAVHGTPADPVVDVQVGDTVLQKKLGDATPDGWQIVQIDRDSVTFRKKMPRKTDAIKTVGIGHGNRVTQAMQKPGE